MLFRSFASVRPRLPRFSGLSDAGLLPGTRLADRDFPVMLDILAAASDPALALPSPVREIARAEDPPFAMTLADGTRVLLSGDDVRGKLRWFPRLVANAEKRGLRFAEYDMTPSRNFAARAAKDWPRSDALRARLQTLGYLVKDTPKGQVATPIQ